SDPPSAANHFTATEASTIRLIVVAVLADQVCRINVRVRAHRPNPPRLLDEFLTARFDELAKRFLRGIAQRTTVRRRFLLQATRHVFVAVAYQNIDQLTSLDIQLI